MTFWSQYQLLILILSNYAIMSNSTFWSLNWNLVCLWAFIIKSLFISWSYFGAIWIEAILLDPVYTSKGFAALIDYVQKGIIKKGDNVIFIYTGGSPAVFAYNEDINNPK